MAAQRKFTLGPLGTLNQLVKALGKTIRAMADGTLETQAGGRICNGLGIMRACLEAQQLEELGKRLDVLEDADRASGGRPQFAAENARRLQ